MFPFCSIAHFPPLALALARNHASISFCASWKLLPPLEKCIQTLGASSSGSLCVGATVGGTDKVVEEGWIQRHFLPSP
jgi:hypothetical protein